MLYGMMGAGKSTVAGLVASRLGRTAVDTDDEIVRWTGRTIPQLFAERGESGFRELERQVVEELAKVDDLVISLGGGAVLRDDVCASLLLSGVLLHLDAPAGVLAARVAQQGGDRPLLDGADVSERVAAILEERLPRYREVADGTIDASGTPEAVAEAVVEWAVAHPDVLTPSEFEAVAR